MNPKMFVRILLIIIPILILDAALQQTLLQRRQNEQFTETSLALGTLRVTIEKEILSNLLLIQGTANYISVHPSLTQQEFGRFAEGALQSATLLKNIGAAPGFIMRFVYPLAGNAKILGMDYRSLPAQWPQARKVRETGRMIIAGPLPLVQGGTGLIGRAPVFIQQADGEQDFWGIVSAVIDADKLFRIIARTKGDGLQLAIRGVDGRGPEGTVFLGDEDLFEADRKAILMPVEFPSGSWQLAALPSGGWATKAPFSSELHFLMAFLAAVSIVVGYRAMHKTQLIRQIKTNLDEAQALVHLGSWDRDIRRETVWWSDETYRIFDVTRETFTPTVEAFFNSVHPDDLERVQKAYFHSLEMGETFSVDHRIIRADETIRHVHVQGLHTYDGQGNPIHSLGTIHDITERKRIEVELESEQRKFSAMIEATYDACIMINPRDEILFWSSAAEKIFGWTREEALGRKMHLLITPQEYHEDAHRGLQHFARSGEGAVLDSVAEFMAIKKNGDLFPVERSVSAFQTDGEYYAVGMLRDITERKAAEAELERLAETDGLTGLYNRRRFMQLAETEIKRCRRNGKPLSLFMFDADKFKSINDTYGHDVGDKVLIDLARIARTTLREIDVIARIGGEEFVALLPETAWDGALRAAERLRMAIEGSVVMTPTESVRFTVSLGVTQFTAEDAVVDPVLKRADNALYRAKQNGRNRVEVEHRESGMESF